LDKLGLVMMGVRENYRRWAQAAVIALLGTLIVCGLGAAPASAAMRGFLAPTTTTPPTATFTFPTPDVTGGAITFDASGTVDPNGGTITQYSWDFGDGTAIVNTSSATVAHTYASPQSPATVTLTVTDSEGDVSAPDSQSITVTQAQLPSASFTFPTPDVTGGEITFDASASNDPNPRGSITQYSWDFGDGTGTFITTSPTITHTYTTPQSPATVTLTVTDFEGDTAPTAEPITVTQAQPPAAMFTAPSGAEGAPLSFDGSSSTDPNQNGTITSYAWNFGDGTTASGPTQTHAYTQQGSYTATLTVTDSYGQTNTSTQTVVVSDMPVSASIAVFPSTPSVGTVIAFTGIRTGDPDEASATYAWRFGDGTQTNGTSVAHLYEEAGTYTVVLTINDQDGQVATAKQRVTVAPLAYSPSAPRAVFVAPRGRAGTPVAFDGSRSSRRGTPEP
jgi:PKD repeat protein